MKWKIVQASVIGTSHLARGTSCQDKCCTDILYDRQGNEIFIGIVSDGAGSAIKGLQGAEIACMTALKEIRSWITLQYDVPQFSSETEIVQNRIEENRLQFYEIVQNSIEKIGKKIEHEADVRGLCARDYVCTLFPETIQNSIEKIGKKIEHEADVRGLCTRDYVCTLFPETIQKQIEKIGKKIEHEADARGLQTKDYTCTLFPEIVRKSVEKIGKKIEHEADVRGLQTRDYACTLLGAIIAADFSAYFQVGDGAMVVYDGEYKLIFFPDTGEYANTTFFVIDESVYDHLHVRIHPGRIDEVALFSDGLQRLALHYKSKTAHGPFFEPMFSVLRKQSPGYSDILSRQLGKFLNSKAVNERTDDDKTLIMATRKM